MTTCVTASTRHQRPRCLEADVCFPVRQTWTPHYFVLTRNKIYYSEETSHYQAADQEEDEEVKEVERR